MKLSKRWKITLGVIIVLALIVFVAKLIIGSQIKPIVEKEASKILGTKVSIGGISLGLLTGDFGIKNFKIANPEGFSKDALVSFDAFGVKVSYPALLKKQIILNQVYLNKPEVNLEIKKGNKINVLTLLAKMPKQKEKKEQPLPAFMVKKVTVSGGRVKVTDSGFSDPASVHSLDNIKFVLTHLTNLANPPKDAGNYKLTATLDRKSPMVVEGNVKPFDKKMSFNTKASLNNIVLADFSNYYAKKSPVAIKTGVADLRLTLACIQEVLNGLCNVKVKNLDVGSPSGKQNVVGGLSSALTDYLKDSKGLLDLSFKITGPLKKPDIGFMDALNKLLGNILSKAAKKAVESKVMGEVKSKIRIRF